MKASIRIKKSAKAILNEVAKSRGITLDSLILAECITPAKKNNTLPNLDLMGKCITPRQFAPSVLHPRRITRTITITETTEVA